MRPATIVQVANARQLVGLVPDWADRLNGAEWERCFDLVEDGTKFVSFDEAADVIEALTELADRDAL